MEGRGGTVGGMGGGRSPRGALYRVSVKARL